MIEEKLFNIEYWLPFNGGEYHCTIAAGVTQSYVDRVKEQYERDLQRWRITPSAFRLPFFHTLNITDHIFMSKDTSFINIEAYNKEIDKVRQKGIEEGQNIMSNSMDYYITDQKKRIEFRKYYNIPI